MKSKLVCSSYVVTHNCIVHDSLIEVHVCIDNLYIRNLCVITSLCKNKGRGQGGAGR